MELIAPNKISGEIFDIIDEADEYLVLVSPYIQIAGWPNLTSKLKSVVSREIKFRMYVRDGQDNLKSINQLQKLGIRPYLIPNLHTKLYFNEKDALTTSMNLLRSSDQHSLEIGHRIETKKEYNEIVEYYKRYIFPFEENKSDFKTTLEDEIFKRLKSHFPKMKIYSNYNTMQIRTGNSSFDIEIEKKNHESFLVIKSVISKKEYDYRSHLLTDFTFPKGLGIDFIEGGERNYDQAIGFSQNRINSKQISNVINSEKEMIAKLISCFIKNIEDFKSSNLLRKN
jgi:phosphatidylserine/phosphatidylglycerophosphate/cardiolipin synthase-like enzyme